MKKYYFFGLTLIGIVILTLFNSIWVKRLINGYDPNEIEVHSFTFTSIDGKEQRSTFYIPYGYIEKYLNNESGKNVHLVINYPTKAYADESRPNPRAGEVDITIRQGNRVLGDDFEQLLATGRLGERHTRVVEQRDGMVVLELEGKKSTSDAHEQYYLFKDTARGHSILNRHGIGDFRNAEGVIADQSAVVFYNYRNTPNISPKDMHEWVMDFVESLKKPPTTPQKGKKP
jgi:hypothetical protein